MIFASDNDPRVHFYRIDYRDENLHDSICYPSVREYDGFDEFYEDHEDYMDDFYYDYDFDFHETDYDDAMTYDIEDMVCYDEMNDLWGHVD